MQDTDKQYVECQGGEIVDFQVLPPNEVTSINKLSAGIGSKDKSQLHWIDILITCILHLSGFHFVDIIRMNCD